MSSEEKERKYNQPELYDVQLCCQLKAALAYFLHIFYMHTFDWDDFLYLSTNQMINIQIYHRIHLKLEFINLII